MYGLGITELVSWGVLIYSFPVLALPMHAQLGWSYAQLDAAYAVGVVVSGLAGIPVGRWLQRHGPRALMTGGSVLTAMVLLAWSQVRSLPALFAVFVAAGLAMSATLYEPALATAAVWFVVRRPHAVLVVTVLAGLSSVVFVPLTSALIVSLGWRHTVLVLGAIAALVGIPTHALLLRRDPAALGLRPDGVPEAGSRTEPPPPGREPGYVPTPVLRRSSFRWLTSCLTLATMAKSVVVIGLVAYLNDRGYPLATAALAAGGIGLTQVLGRALVVALRGRWPEARIASAAFGAQAGAAALLLATPGHDAAATVAVGTFVVVFGIGCGLVELLRGTILPAYYGAHEYPRVNGVLSAFVVSARAAGPALVSAVLAATGTFAPVLAGVAAMTLGSGGSLIRAEQAHRQEPGPH